MKINRTFKHWWQRRTRGWDDSETWNLNAELARWLTPRLRRFKELTNGIPSEYCTFDAENSDVTDDEKADATWHADLDKMIAAFEWCADERRYGNPEPPYVPEGLRLFQEHFHSLWW